MYPVYNSSTCDFNKTENKGVHPKATVVNSIKFSILFPSALFPLPAPLPSPFSQLLSVSPRRVQGSISFNNLHIHDSHREWHPAGLDHNAETRPEHNISHPVSSLTLFMSGKLFTRREEAQSNKSLQKWGSHERKPPGLYYIYKWHISICERICLVVFAWHV